MNASVAYSTNNSTRGFALKESEYAKTAKAIAILMVGGFGLLGNIFIIVLAVKYTVRKNLHHLIVNMAVADTLVVLMKLISVLPKLFQYDMWDGFNGVSGDIYCKVLPFLTKMFIHESLVTLLIISIERCKATRQTVHIIQPYTLKQRLVVLICSWLIPVVLTSYNLFFREFIAVDHQVQLFCWYHGPKMVFVRIWIVIENALLLITFGFIFILSILTLRQLSKPRGIHSNLCEEQRLARRKRTASAMRMVQCSLLLYTCCYLPYVVLTLFAPGRAIATADYVSDSHFIVLFFLPLVNSCLSPCVYMVFFKDFRQAARRLVWTQRRRNRLEHQPVQETPEGIQMASKPSKQTE